MVGSGLKGAESGNDSKQRSNNEGCNKLSSQKTLLEVTSDR